MNRTTMTKAEDGRPRAPSRATDWLRRRAGLMLVSLGLCVGGAVAQQPLTVQKFQKISALEGNFSGPLGTSDFFGQAVDHLGDLDGDGVDDLAVAMYGEDGLRGAVNILFLNADGTVRDHQLIKQGVGGFTGGLTSGGRFGVDLHVVGDIDGDDIVDLAVGNDRDDDGGFDKGAVWILFLNTNGTVRAQQKISDTQGGFTGSLGTGTSGGFGGRLGGLGDLDGDGVPDIAVRSANNVWILFLNSNGTVKAHHRIARNIGGFTGVLDVGTSGFGADLDGIGDLDGDGVTEMAVAENASDDGAVNAGAVWILFLETNGTVKAQQKISALHGGFAGNLDGNDRFGGNLKGLPDLNGDDIPDLGVVAWEDDDGHGNAGALWLLFLDSDGSVKDHAKISATEGNFLGNVTANGGFAVDMASIGDFDGNGAVDFAVGNARDDDGATDAGAVWMLFLGITMDCPADVVLDGPADISTNAIGAPTASSACGDVTLTYSDAEAPPSLYDLTDTVVAHYRLNDNTNNNDVIDSSGNGLHGVFVDIVEDSATAEHAAPGWIDGALSFDGNSDWVDLNAHVAGLQRGKGAISIWFRTDANFVNGVLFHISNTTIGNHTSVVMGNWTGFWPDESLLLDIRRGSNTPRIFAALRKGHDYFNDCRWHHILFMVGDDFNEIYIDGVREDLSYVFGSPETGGFFLNPLGASRAAIGRRLISGSGANVFHGEIEHVAIFDRPLSEGEAEAFYRSGLGTESLVDIGTMPSDCPASPTISRTWTAVDACSNEATCFQTIRILETNTIQLLCPDLTLECLADPDPESIGYPEVVGDGGEIRLQYCDATISAVCGETREIERVWTAVSLCAGTASCTQYIDIVDTTPPVLTCPPDVELAAPADTDVEFTGYATAVDACGGRLAESLIAYYPFNGDAIDATGNGHDGVVHGPELTEDRFGNPNSAYLFDGIDDFIAVDDHVDLRLSGTDHTIAAWVRHDIDAGAERADVIVNKRLQGSANGWNFAVTGSGGLGPGHLVYVVSGGGDPFAVSIDTLVLGSWRFVTITYDYGAQTVRIYIDGELDRVVGGISTPNPATTAQMIIGKVFFDGVLDSYFWTGAMDEIRLYDRALSATEIRRMTEHFGSGVGSDLTFSDSVLSGDGFDSISRVWSANDDCGNNAVCTQRITVIDANAPVAQPGGPYIAAVGETVQLDGSGSFDPDEGDGDMIQAWDWDVASPLNYADGAHGALARIRGGFPTAGDKTISLRVTDSSSSLLDGIAIGTNEVLIDFESLPDGSPLVEGMAISNQYQATHGVVFTHLDGSSSELARLGSPFAGFSSAAGIDVPVAGQNVGSSFLVNRAGGRTQATLSPHVIELDDAAVAVGGVVLDNDGEAWLIEAFDSAGALLDSVVVDDSSPNAGDGRAAPWLVSASSNAIRSVTIAHIGGTGFGIGYALDNFVVSRQIIHEVELGNLTGEATTTVVVYEKTVDDLEVRPKETKNQLTWTPFGDIAAVMRSTNGPNHGYVEIARTTSDYATYLDEPIELERAYFYRIFSYDASGTNLLGISSPIVGQSFGRNGNRPPVFTSTPLEAAIAGEPYEYAAVAEDPTDDPLIYALRFGPAGLGVGATGLVSWTPSPAQIGLHDVVIEAEDDGGAVGLQSYQLVVFPASNNTPVADANGPYEALVGESVAFLSAGSDDADGDPLGYLWNFGDGNISTEANPAHTYADSGSFRVTLFVTDGRGGRATASTTATIEYPNRSPIAAIANTNHVLRLGQAVTLDASPSSDPDDDVLSYTWTWDDGEISTNAGEVATRTYTNQGSFNGSVLVDDARGGDDAAIFTVTVGPANQAPVATFAVTQVGVNIGDTFEFDPAGTFDPEGDPLSFLWDFGDNAESAAGLVHHVYQAPGDFIVSFTATDNFGASGVHTQVITVLNDPPVISSTPTTTAEIGVRYAYVVQAVDPEGQEVDYVLDSAPSGMVLDAQSGRIEWQPVGGQEGTNPVSVEVSDPHGASATQNFAVVVDEFSGQVFDLRPLDLDVAGVVTDPQTLALSGAVSFAVTNGGTAGSPHPVAFTVFEDRDNDRLFTLEADSVLADGRLTDLPPPGVVVNVSTQIAGAALFRDSRIAIFIDSDDAVVESNEVDNIVLTLDGCDPASNVCLDVSASFLRVNANDMPSSAVLTARMGNAGTVPVPTGATMAFYDGDPDVSGVLIGVATTSVELAVGNFVDLDVSWLAPSEVIHDVFVVADDDGAGAGSHAEISEANNAFSTPVDLQPNQAPEADAGVDRQVRINRTIVLDGSGSDDPEASPLTYTWSSASIPVGSFTQLQGADTVAPSFIPDVPGVYTIRLIVNDGQRDSVADLVEVTAIDEFANEGPSVTSTPVFDGMATVPYEYQVLATDPNEDPLTYSLNQSPAGMTIDAAGLIEWTSPTVGSHTVIVLVDDGEGALAGHAYTLTIAPYQDLPPRITSPAIVFADTNSPYVYAVEAEDPNEHTLGYTLTESPAGMIVNPASGVIDWSPTSGDLGAHRVTVVATEQPPAPGLSDEQSYILLVVADLATSPRVDPISDQVVTDPAPFVTINLDNIVDDPDHADNQIVWTTTGDDVLMVDISPARVATITYTNGTRVTEEITFVATDPDGNVGSATASFTARGPDQLPIAALANLDTGFNDDGTPATTTIREGLYDLRGTADDPDAIDPVSYRVRLYHPDGSLAADVTPGPVNPQRYHERRVPATGSLGELDFTMLRNGVYDLVLTVRGGNRSATAEARIALDSQLKVGQFSFSVEDITIPIQGVPLTLVRTYDSLNTDDGPFGHSWSYDIAEIDMKIDERRTQTIGLFGDVYSLRIGGGRNVTLTMPDTGRRVTFRYSVVRTSAFSAKGVWTPPPGVYATLQPTGPNKLVILQGAFGDPIQYWQSTSASTPMENFDFAAYVLTTKDGTKYRIDRTNQGEHFLDSGGAGAAFVTSYTGGHITEITTRVGDRLDFVRDGVDLARVDHYNPVNERTKSLVFERNGQDRIIRVYDPMWIDPNGNPTGPASMKYDYDGAGNLTHAHHLADESDPTNAVYATTEYKYESQQFPHYITEVVNPRGIPSVRTEYDSSGRIIATVDASGNRIELEHDLGALTELVRDASGNATIHAFDLRGNLVATTDPLGNTTRSTHDEDGNVLTTTDALGARTSYGYDGTGRRTSVTDALTNTTVFTYDEFGNQLTTTDALGHSTTNHYDARGNLVASRGHSGERITLSYDARGNLAELRDAAGNILSRFTYNEFGQMTRVVDDVGFVRDFQYDSRGRQSATGYEWVNPGDSNDVVSLSASVVADARGQVVESADSLGNQSRVSYNELGQIVSTTDSLGLDTRLTYDSRGNEIETLVPGGAVTRTVYDANSRPVVRTDLHIAGELAAGALMHYDSAGRLVRVEKIEGVAVSLVPQVSGGKTSMTSIVSSQGSVVSSVPISYDAAGRVVAHVDGGGTRTELEYDALGRVTTVEDSSGNRTEFEYDAVGRNVLTRDALLRETRFAFDEQGRLVRTTFADGTFVETAYDALGRRSSETDQAGKTTDFEYDVQGRMTSVVLPPASDPYNDGLSTRPRYEYDYDRYGSLQTIRDPMGRETRFEYDEHLRQVARVLPLGQRETAEYDRFGRLARRTDFMGNVTDTVYDSLGRRSEKHFYAATNTPPDFVDIVLAGGVGVPDEIIRFTYDELGRQVGIIEDRGTTTVAYDINNRLIHVDAPEGTINYDHDAATGRRTRTFTEHTETAYTYDELGRLRTAAAVKRMGQVLPIPEVTTYGYSSVGTRTSQELPNGVTTTYQYDNLNRLTQLGHANGAGDLLASYGYIVRADGRQTAVTELQGASPGYTPATNAIAYSYDGLNRLTRETAINPNNGAGHDTTYVYDLVGNRLERTIVANGQILRTLYEYNDNDQLMSEVNTTELAGIPVRSDDERYPAGVYFAPKPTASSWYGFWGLGVLALLAFLLPLWPRRSLANPRAGGPVLRPRLPGWMRSIAAGLAGLMLVTGPAYQVLAQEADLYAQLSTHDWRSEGVVITYEYDDNGSLVHETRRVGPEITLDKVYRYNLQNRLSSVTTTHIGSPEVVDELSYVYNQSGVRVSRREVVLADDVVEFDQTKLYLVDPSNHTGHAQVLEELSAPGAVPTRSYVIGDDILSQVDQSASSVQHLLYDGHGSTRQLSDASGALGSRYAYDAYGVMLGGSPGSDALEALGVGQSSAVTDMLYSGEQYDSSLEKQYLRARYNDNSTGVFSRRDPFPGAPFTPATLHGYRYAGGDPVNAVDPNGMYFSLVATTIAAAIDTTVAAASFVSITLRSLSLVSRTGYLYQLALLVRRLHRSNVDLITQLLVQRDITEVAINTLTKLIGDVADIAMDQFTKFTDKVFGSITKAIKEEAAVVFKTYVGKFLDEGLRVGKKTIGGKWSPRIVNWYRGFLSHTFTDEQVDMIVPLSTDGATIVGAVQETIDDVKGVIRYFQGFLTSVESVSADIVEFELELRDQYGMLRRFEAAAQVDSGFEL